MNAQDQINRDYNYYPNTAVELCVISYDDIDTIRHAVSHQTGLEVVWGPAQLTDEFCVSYSLMYVAKKAATGEYFVVIRGTNFESLESWLLQDFDVATSQRFSDLPGNPPNVPEDALISQGTFNGMTDLLSLTDPVSNYSLVDFLTNENPNYLYVTGHSLGGTLTPPLFAYLNAMLYGGNSITNMALWSFAGLTPGGAGFNAYFNNILPNNQNFLWRLHNTLDIAPFFWYSLSDVQNIYATENLSWSDLEEDPISYLFKQADYADIGYAQPQVGLALTGQFDNSFPDGDLWPAQAAYQHHSTTYKQLVKRVYPSFI